MPQLTIPAWWVALPPGSWLPCALRTSSGAAQGPMAGCGAAVRPGQSRQLCSCHTPRQAQRSAADAADAVAALLGARADPTARTRAGSTPLHLACEAGAAACAAALLTAGAEAGVANSDGVTPLHAAAAAGSEACLASLLGAGAPPGLQPHASGLHLYICRRARCGVASSTAAATSCARATEQHLPPLHPCLCLTPTPTPTASPMPHRAHAPCPMPRTLTLTLTPPLPGAAEQHLLPRRRTPPRAQAAVTQRLGLQPPAHTVGLQPRAQARGCSLWHLRLQDGGRDRRLRQVAAQLPAWPVGRRDAA